MEEVIGTNNGGAGGQGPAAAQASRCGDAIVSPQRDDGNSSNTDRHLNTRTFATCGDGYVRTSVEDCDINIPSSPRRPACTDRCILCDPAKKIFSLKAQVVATPFHPSPSPGQKAPIIVIPREDTWGSCELQPSQPRFTKGSCGKVLNLVGSACIV